MKTTNQAIITILFFFFMIQMSAQNELKFGRHGPDCKGSGICSFSESKGSQSGNATILYQGNSIVLRIFRDEITEEEEYKLLGKRITLENSKSMNVFTMEATVLLEEHTISKNNRELTDQTTQPLLQKIEAGTYSLKISEDYIDILIK